MHGWRFTDDNAAIEKIGSCKATASCRGIGSEFHQKPFVEIGLGIAQLVPDQEVDDEESDNAEFD